jgi:hypothetical protein
MNRTNYWEDCIAEAAEECGLTITSEQLSELAESVRIGHDNYGMAFYSPPASDRIHDIESKWQDKVNRLQREFDSYRSNAERAVKIALHQRADSNVTIGEYGEVFRHGGRTEQIQ